MKIIFICLAVFIVATAMFLLYREYYIRIKYKKLATYKYKIFEPLIRKLIAHELITAGDIFPLAQNPSTRYALFGILKKYGQESQFPAEYLTIEKGAESFMVNWLEFPTELGAAPSEINLLSKVTLDAADTALDYYVFQYKTEQTAQFGWMLGVSGPYTRESHPYDVPKRVFSRFNKADGITAEEEAKWVHENICREQGT